MFRTAADAIISPKTCSNYLKRERAENWNENSHSNVLKNTSVIELNHKYVPER